MKLIVSKIEVINNQLKKSSFKLKLEIIKTISITSFYENKIKSQKLINHLKKRVDLNQYFHLKLSIAVLQNDNN